MLSMGPTPFNSIYLVLYKVHVSSSVVYLSETLTVVYVLLCFLFVSFRPIESLVLNFEVDVLCTQIVDQPFSGPRA